ncbi:MAG: HypC/HybG/HupF family hydrogenase formation chaperone [bacterium]|nr:HypC/HybG/HupF family hydrogenase formation chaperone [bacterium]
MCLAIPGKVHKIEGKKVWVKYPHAIREVLAGDEPVKVGDFVLVQMGIILKIVSLREAASSLKAWKSFS